MMRGEQISFVPAHHISLAKTIAELRIMKAANKADFDAMYVNFGGQTFTADTILNQFDNFDSVKRYLDLLDSEFNVSSLSANGKGWKVDAIYMDRLPTGIDDIKVMQLNDTAKHTMALRKLLMHGGMDAVGEKLLAESTFWRNLENYAPDFYRQYASEFGKADVTEQMWRESVAFMLKQGYNGDRWRKSIQKALRNVSERESIGLISDPRYYVAKGVYQLVGDIRFKRFIKTIENSTLEGGIPIVRDTPARGYTLAGKKARDADRWLTPVLEKGKLTGGLKGRYVHISVYKYLKRGRSLDSNDFMYWYNDQLLRRWKFGMTVLNPTTHLRNAFSNLIMADMAGLNPFMSPSAKQADLKATIKEYLSREGAVIDEAMRGNLFGSTFADVELKAFLEQVSRSGKRSELPKKMIPQNMQELGMDFMREWVWKAESGLRNLELTPKNLRWLRDKAKKAYIAEDEVFKLWRFKQIRVLQKEFRANGGIITQDMRRALGADNEKLLGVLNHADDLAAIRAAASDSHKWFFDYSDIPGWVDAVRKTAMPFFTYSYNAVPRVAKWMNRNPIKAFAWRETFDWVNFTNEFMHGDPTFEDVYDTQLLRAKLPAYARLTSVMLPKAAGREFDMVKRKTMTMTKNARLAPAWDVQYWTQLGGLYKPSEAYQRSGLAGFVEKYIQNPIVPTLATLANRPAWDMFGDRNLVSREDSWVEGLAKRTSQVMNIWSPSWATPGIPQQFKEGNRVVDLPEAIKGIGLALLGGGAVGGSRAAFLGGLALLGGGRSQR